MRASLKTLLGSAWSDVLEDGTVDVPPWGGLLILDSEDDRFDTLEVDGAEIPLRGAQKPLVYPIGPLSAGKLLSATVVLASRKRVRFRFRGCSGVELPEEVLTKLSQFWRGLESIAEGGRLTFATVIEAVSSRALPLFVSLMLPTTEEYDRYTIPIEQSLPSLVEVCNRPRLHLRTENSILPIHSVRRFGYRALTHLACHPEHWLTRTLAGIRPERLLAETIEDDVDLYENRVVRTLVDRIDRTISKLLRHIGMVTSQGDERQFWEEYNEESEDYSSRWKLLRLLASSSGLSDDETRQLRYRQIRTLLRSIAESISMCKSSWMYRQLQNCQPVQPPLRHTNILLMDRDYRELRDLWHELDRLEGTNEGDAELDDGDPIAHYIAFCQVVVLSALEVVGFVPSVGRDAAVADISPSGLRTSASFTKGPWSITLSVEDWDRYSSIRLSFRKRAEHSVSIPPGVNSPSELSDCLSELVQIHGRTLRFLDRPSDEMFGELASLRHEVPEASGRKGRRGHKTFGTRDKAWASFIHDVHHKFPKPRSFDIDVIPVLTALGDGPHMLDRITKALLKDAVSHSSRCGSAMTVMLVPVGPQQAPSESPPAVLRRVLSLGDRLSPDDMAQWGGFTTGILPVSPVRFKSLHALVRLVYASILRADIEDGDVSDCPLCSGVGAPDDKAAMRCHSCGTLWGIRTCDNPDCGHRFAFVRPGGRDTAQLRKEEWPNYARWIERIDSIAGLCAPTAFCEAETEDLACIPICPKCGSCSRADSNEGRCHRCWRTHAEHRIGSVTG